MVISVLVVYDVNSLNLTLTNSLCPGPCPRFVLVNYHSLLYSVEILSVGSMSSSRSKQLDPFTMFSSGICRQLTVDSHPKLTPLFPPVGHLEIGYAQRCVVSTDKCSYLVFDQTIYSGRLSWSENWQQQGLNPQPLRHATTSLTFTWSQSLNDNSAVC